MGFQIHIRTETAAFEDDPTREVTRILREVADKIEQGEDASLSLTIFDVNGNDVGRYKLTEREE